MTPPGDAILHRYHESGMIERKGIWMTKTHNERCRECKNTVRNMLAAIFGDIRFNWDIALPSRIEDYLHTDVYGDIEPIYQALQTYRGHREFVKAKRLPRVDFFIPKSNTIIEFDESQHFTVPRGITLDLYPRAVKHGFQIEKWRKLCETLKKRDNDPPYRDEQRAWYDTLRDFAPMLWQSGSTIRLFSRDFAWCSLNPKVKHDVETFMKFVVNQGDHHDSKSDVHY